jgi:hypothetical protein
MFVAGAVVGFSVAPTAMDLERGANQARADPLPNGEHASSGCPALIMSLKQASVNVQPLADRQQMGIRVYLNEGAFAVNEAVSLVSQVQARELDPAQTCGGGDSNCVHH